MIFDSLTHSTINGKWFSTNFDASLENLLDHKVKHSVGKSVISGLAEPEQNLFTLELGSKHPDKFFPVSVIKNQSKSEILKQCERYIGLGAKGLKIHPRWSGFALDDPTIDVIFNVAKEKDIPVFLCTVTTGVKHSNSLPTIIGELVKKNDNVKIVLLHGGYVDLLATSEVIRPYENVILDLSATLCRFYDSSIGSDIKYLFRTFDKRICLGTDFPEYTYDNVYEALRFLNIEESLDGPLGNNLKIFLNAK